MKKNITQLIFICVIAVSLAACQMVQQVQRTFKTAEKPVCDSKKVEQFNNVAWNLKYIKLGMDTVRVQAHLGIPAKWESFVLTDGREVQVMFYRTNYRNCDLTQSAWGEFLPMIFANDKLIGYGNDYYDNMIRPAITQNSASWKLQQQMQEEEVKQFPYGEQDYYNY